MSCNTSDYSSAQSTLDGLGINSGKAAGQALSLLANNPGVSVGAQFTAQLGGAVTSFASFAASRSDGTLSSQLGQTAAAFGVAAAVVGLAAGTLAAAPVALAIAAATLGAAGLYAGYAAAIAKALESSGCPPNDPDYDPNDQPVSPLIIDLDGNGVQSTSLATSLAFFDLNADGFSERTAWASATDGLLALDRNGNGAIDDITELFGTETSNGFTILSQLDENHDGVITEADVAFGDLRVWRDGNGDGKSTANELLSLAELGITSIDAVGTALPNGTTNNGNTVSHTGTVTFADGHTTAVDDVWFEHTRTVTKVNMPADFAYSDEALELPDVEGMGLLADLQYAMTVGVEAYH